MLKSSIYKNILYKLRDKKYLNYRKLLLFLLLLFIIYAFENCNLSEKLYSKKYAIEFLKNFLLEDLVFLNLISFKFINFFIKN